MSEMVERVARAIVDTWAAGAVGVDADGWDAQDDFGKDAARKCARAAIAAMREPTGAMCEDAAKLQGDAHHFGPGDAGLVWRDMIDAALIDK